MYYFLLKPFNGAKQANYQHGLIVFAEGLKSNNISFSANIDYFPIDLSGNTLFKSSDSIPNETIYILTSSPVDYKEEIINYSKKYRVIIFDSHDEWFRPQSISFLKYCYRYFMTTTKEKYLKFVKPFCFAITNRLLDVSNSQKVLKWEDRSSDIFWAHRVDNHQIRNKIKYYYDSKQIKYHKHLDNFAEPDNKDLLAFMYWTHTGKSPNPYYFSELRKYKYIDAHGGYDSNDGIVQWDSWKIWEGFLSGNVVITADLDYYNIKLPFTLIPYKHYIPIRYDNIEKSYDIFFKMNDLEKETIALAGQKYALEYFTPKSIAKYIMDNLD